MHGRLAGLCKVGDNPQLHFDVSFDVSIVDKAYDKAYDKDRYESV